ncbi:TonB-dependent receptor [Flagellimonas halotolerans]|uniref:TonB-dependent receptor n=1 Tax=Flagellimonas halotolerans TaxID=3112164 RepID=A0ABU6IPH8_9FLAO|nr:MULTISPECIES: TonB-dependent receptor [unclassified Allomuricauda]MEC3965216.1 TonB-dependent receptor [Muricauda sp. SYSU M86414]MEC4264939.1 TonB-dependent receptor [Muricauda sp. SYSU M84420]
MRKRTYIFSLLFLSLCGAVIAQEEDSIGTETVTVVKPYSPTVSDAFKIKSSPSLNDSIVLQKKKINYSIFSVPVASTFTPAKGKASGVEKTPSPTLYNSYASVGLGNYNNALVDFYTSRDFNRGEDLLDFGLSHNSSRGDLDSTPLETDFYDTKLNASYTKKDRYMDWGAAIGLQHQLYNWYGIQSDLFSEDEINAMDEQQNYFNAEAKAHFNMEDSYFKSGNILLRRFWDATESAENRAVINPTFELPITEELITISAKVDYVGGSFQNGSITEGANDGEKKYSNLQAGVTPSLLILRDDLTINLGANLVYGLDMENSENNFYIYPAVNASYRVMDENVIAYGGIEGELKQNSYHDFVDDNPYVSPTLDIVPTDQQYEGYLGLKGQLTSNLGYNIKGSYMAENRKPLYFHNTVNTSRMDEKSYYYGNSFQVFYDDVKTLGVFGEINVDVNRNFSLGVNGEFYDYDTETDNPAWNLPSIKASVFMDYQINDQWYMGANLFYVGERDDLLSTISPINMANPPVVYTPVTLDGFFDANAHVGYRFNGQLSIFVKASNIANNNYQRWANFRVQGFQALAGVSYKFDF